MDRVEPPKAGSPGGPARGVQGLRGGGLDHKRHVCGIAFVPREIAERWRAEARPKPSRRLSLTSRNGDFASRAGAASRPSFQEEMAMRRAEPDDAEAREQSRRREVRSSQPRAASQMIGEAAANGARLPKGK